MFAYENFFKLDPGEVQKQADAQYRRGPWVGFFDPTSPDDDERWILHDQSERSRNYHAHSLDMLDLPLMAHSITGDSDYLAKSAEVALDWSRRYGNRASMAAPSGETDMAWYDMAAGLRAYRLAYLLEAMREADLGSSEERDLLWSTLLLHAGYLADDDNIMFHNNHGFYQVAGQLAMARRYADEAPEMARAKRQGQARLDRMIHQQFGDDGAHMEHSPDYHRMVYSTVQALIDAGLVEDDAIIAFADRIERALSWFVQPNGHIANIGDSDHQLVIRPRKLARRQWKSEEMRYAATAGRIGTPPATPIAAFRDAGYFAARVPQKTEPTFATDSYLLQQAGFHSRTHKHADTLGFIWSDRGQPILVDAGRYGYVGKTEAGSKLRKDGFWYSDPYRIYCESTRAHNCLEFDGENYPRQGVKPFGSATGRSFVADDTSLIAFETEARHFEGMRHARLLVMAPGRWLVCFDWFKNNLGKRHDATQWFHLAPGLEARQDGLRFAVDLPSYDVPLQIAPLLGSAKAADCVSGRKEPRYQGWFSRGYKKIMANAAIGYRLQRANCQAAATLFAFGEDFAVDVSANAVDTAGRNGRLGWTADGKTHLLEFSRPSEGEISFDYTVSD
ncbi:heparinase II/III domain-containing protein [Sphingomicrobium clamense]|uniref:Heparinase II/III family protein n=1 Tax=Sphingomicrobium clamense TaxID=2851013 RepID=A0ABS6V4I6_9SPHN|nr:heparinase II/III family protein [Sphingomicrobium sp. B8]MBW0144471.1 heparinase II/III family protein [Sphingomicrobium sp. B8]